MKPSFILFIVVFHAILADAQQYKTTDKTYRLIFQNVVDGSLLCADSTYQNHIGEAFNVRSCKYYISHLQLQYANGKICPLQTNPRLINEADSTSKIISFTAPDGVITDIQFLLGIDSITNTSGVQTGDLDPAKGMFWIWNTGYIMAKLEGSSAVSKLPGKQYSYDIGGYKPSESVARTIHLSLPLQSSRQSSAFIIKADIGKWFYGKNNISIGKQPMCHAPGLLARQIADNYADMFSLSTQ